MDRDGTLNHDPGYLSDPEQMNLLPGVLEALGRLQAAGFALVVVSNQSGVGRGLIQAEQMKKIHERLDLLLAQGGVQLSGYELCFHRPEDQCDCRKPKPKLLIDAASRLHIDLAQSYMVGDKCSDIECAKNAGCQASIMVRTGEGHNEEMRCPRAPDHVANDLLGAAEWILSQLDFS